MALAWALKQVYRLLRFLTSRLALFSLLIVVQVAILAVAIVRLSAYSYWVFGVFYLISLLAVLFIVSNDQHPSYKIAWIIFVMSLPILGGCFYLAVGNNRISRKRLRAHNDYVAQNSALFHPQQEDLLQVREGAPHYWTQAQYIQRVSGFGPSGNTQVEYCPLGEDQQRRMLEELAKAERFILLEYFIIEQGLMWDSILEILVEKAAAGVEVKLMYDDLGCIQTLPEGYHRQLEKQGIQVVVFNPFRPSIDPYMNYRDHRKICVVDGVVGFCGGINLADEYINAYAKYGHWKDTAVILKGDGVWNLTRMFFQEWGYASGQQMGNFEQYRVHQPVEAPGFVHAYPDSPLDNFRVAEGVYLQMINRAENYVYITTPYLILDSEFSTALTMAAESGLDVRIVTPHVADKWYVHAVTRSYYTLLLKSGVKIYEYTPGFIHAKMLVSDDHYAVVGTANLDYRSLYLHHECAVVMVDNPVVHTVRDDILDTITLCQEITLKEMSSRSLWARFLSATLRVLAPIM